MTPELNIRIHGSFRILTESGEDLTPPLSKAQGLLLLLLSGPDGSRGRSWLQDRLWSDRSARQGSASLRQTLSVIRKSLGQHKDILKSNHRNVSLDTSRIILEEDTSLEFAEGLDIRDPEFDLWLAEQRVRRNRTPRASVSEVFINNGARQAPLGRDGVILTCHGDGTDMADWTAQVLSDRLFQSLSECAHIDVFRHNPGQTPSVEVGQIALELDCLHISPDSIGIRLAAIDGLSRRQIWSGRCRASVHGGPPVDELEVLRLVSRAVDAVAVDRTRPESSTDRADALMRLAIDKIFSMDAVEIADADALLASAYEMRPSPLYLAWRLQIRTIQRLERHVSDEKRLRDEGKAFAAYAVETGGENSMILALLGNASLFLFNDPAASLHFAQSSLERNSANAMAVWAASSARLYNGDAVGAYRNATRGRRIVMHSKRQFFWDLQLAATAMVLGRKEEAQSLLETVTLVRPSFRPPLRYLLALNATEGREDSAVHFSDRLKSLEPDFSPLRMFEDKTYPASLVHRTNLIECSRVTAIV